MLAGMEPLLADDGLAPEPNDLVAPTTDVPPDNLSEPAIAEVVELQDHLGALQDAVVASAILRDFLVWGTWGEAGARRSLPDMDTPVIAPGVAAYLAVKQSELQALLTGFPELWTRFQGYEFSQLIAAAVSIL